MDNSFSRSAVRLLLSAGLMAGLTTAAQAQAPTRPDSATSPARRTLITLEPLTQMGLHGGGVSVERVLTAHTSLVIRGAFSQREWLIGSGGRSTRSSLAAGVRYYFAAHPPKGFYAEATVGVQRNDAKVNDYHFTPYYIVRPEVGAGYQFVLGKQQRFVADVGLRINTQLHKGQFSSFGQPRLPLNWWPTLRFGLAF